MRRLIFVLAVLLWAGAAAWAQGATAAYDMRDTVAYRVKLPGGDRQGLMLARSGRWVVPPRFDAVKQLYTGTGMAKAYLDDVLAVKVAGKWGVADKEGNLLAAPQYSAVVYRGEGLLAAAAGGADYQGGVADKSG